MEQLTVKRLEADLAAAYAGIEQMRANIEKMRFESEKLDAEKRKFERDMRLQPWLLLVAALGAFGGLATALLSIYKGG